MQTFFCILRFFRPSVNHKWSRLPTNPALFKNPHRLLPHKMPGDRSLWQRPMSAGWGARVFKKYFMSRWWWLHGHHLEPAEPGSDPRVEPPGTPCLRRQQSRYDTNREHHSTTLQDTTLVYITHFFPTLKPQPPASYIKFIALNMTWNCINSGYSFHLLLCSSGVQACWEEPGELPVTCWPPPHLAWLLCASGER